MYRDWAGFELFFIEILKCASLPALLQIAHRFGAFLDAMPRGAETRRAQAIPPPEKALDFRALPDMADRSPFARFLTRHKKGEVLFHEGDEGDTMFIVQSGPVADQEEGKGRRRRAGLADGEGRLLRRDDASWSARRAPPRPRWLEDGALIAINGETFGEMLRSNPEIAVRMLRKYSIRLREMNTLLEQMGTQKQAAEQQPVAAPPPLPLPPPVLAPEPVPVPVPLPAAAAVAAQAAAPPAPPPAPQRGRVAVVLPVEPPASGPAGRGTAAVAALRSLAEEMPVLAPPPERPAAAVATAVGVARVVAEPAPAAFLVSKNTGHQYPVVKNESLLGRFDSVTNTHPDVDLSKEENSRNISRRHARLIHRDSAFFLAEEIGAMNGTFINGQRVANGVMNPLSDGDEIMLCRVGLVFRLPT